MLYVIVHRMSPTAGLSMFMLIDVQINEKGVCNVISIVLMINILSIIPSELVTHFDPFGKGKTYAKG